MCLEAQSGASNGRGEVCETLGFEGEPEELSGYLLFTVEYTSRENCPSRNKWLKLYGGTGGGEDTCRASKSGQSGHRP